MTVVQCIARLLLLTRATGRPHTHPGATTKLTGMVRGLHPTWVYAYRWPARRRSYATAGNSHQDRAGTDRGLSSGLIHPRPRAFTSGRRLHVRAGRERSRPVADGGAQYSKACEGATPPWVQIPPPPPLTWDDAEPVLSAHRLDDVSCLSFRLIKLIALSLIPDKPVSRRTRAGSVVPGQE